MKKLKLKIAMVAVVAAVAGYVTYQNQTENVMPELTLANIEALAQNEGGAPQIPCVYESGSTCYYQIKDALGFVWNAQTADMRRV